MRTNPFLYLAPLLLASAYSQAASVNDYKRSENNMSSKSIPESGLRCHDIVARSTRARCSQPHVEIHESNKRHSTIVNDYPVIGRKRQATLMNPRLGTDDPAPF